MKLIAVFVFALMVAVPLSAQDTAAQAQLRLVVIDQTGAGIPSASVVVTPANAEPVHVTTDERGVATVPALPQGAATLQVEFPGFELFIDTVMLRRGATNQTVTLTIEGFMEEIVVDQAASPDTRTNAMSTTLTQEEIDELPDDPEELMALLEQMAGPGGATFTMNGFRGGRLPTRNEIRAIRFRNNSFSADNHDAGRTGVDIVTRPSSDFSGNLNVGFKGDTLNARNAMARVETPEGEKNAQFGLRGPVVARKSSFSFSAQANSAYQSNTIIAVDESGQSLGAQVRSPSERRNMNASFEQLLPGNQSLRFEYQHSRNEGRNQGLGSFDLPERASSRDSTGDMLRARLQGLVGRTTLNEVRVQVNRQQNEATSLTSGPAIIVQDAFSRGGAGVHNRRLTQTLEVANNVDFNVGRRHQMRVGVLFEGGRYSTFDETNKDGRFTFSNLQAYHESRPLQFTQRIGTVDTAFTQYQVGLYWQDDLRLHQTLSVSVGLRQELQSHVADRVNLMPRLGFTWNPGGSATTLRGGYGLFYDWYEASLHDQTLRVNGIAQRDLLIINPGFPDPFAGAEPVILPSGRIQADPRLQLPYLHQASIGMQRRLVQNVDLQVSYQMLRGRNQLRAHDVNTPIEGVRPEAGVGTVTQIGSTGRSMSDRVTVQTRFAIPQRRMNVNVSYTLGQAKNHANSATALPSNSLDPDADWGLSGQDVRHQVQAQAQLPLVFGVRAMGRVSVQSGPAYNMTTGRDNNGDGVINDRPEGVGRNSLRGDGYWTLSSLRLSRQIGFGGARGGEGARGPQRGGGRQGGGAGGFGGPGNERYSMELFVNASNPLNRVIPQSYSGNVLSPFFGKPTRVQQARRVDFGLGFRF